MTGAGDTTTGDTVIQHVRWWCDECDTSGVIEHEFGTGIYDVLESLRSSHASASGGKHTDIAKVYVEGYIGEVQT